MGDLVVLYYITYLAHPCTTDKSIIFLIIYALKKSITKIGFLLYELLVFDPRLPWARQNIGFTVSTIWCHGGTYCMNNPTWVSVTPLLAVTDQYQHLQLLRHWNNHWLIISTTMAYFFLIFLEGLFFFRELEGSISHQG